MNQRLEKIGRTAAVISSLVLSALLINLWVLKADAVEKRTSMPVFEDRAWHIEKKSWFDYAEEMFERVRPKGEVIPAVAVSDSIEGMSGRHPVAFIMLDDIYLVNKQGRLIGRADSLTQRDLPFITGDGILLDKNALKLVDQGSKLALEFLGTIKNYKELEPLVSEIKISDTGITAYFAFTKVVPVIFGTGDWQRKLDNLVAYERQLSGTPLAQSAASLDLRIEDRIVVKKNS